MAAPEAQIPHWDEVVATPEFQSADSTQREQFRQSYRFDLAKQAFLAGMPEKQVDANLKAFDDYSKPGVFQRIKNSLTGQPTAASAAAMGLDAASRTAEMDAAKSAAFITPSSGRGRKTGTGSVMDGVNGLPDNARASRYAPLSAQGLSGLERQASANPQQAIEQSTGTGVIDRAKRGIAQDMIDQRTVTAHAGLNRTVEQALGLPAKAIPSAEELGTAGADRKPEEDGYFQRVLDVQKTLARGVAEGAGSLARAAVEVPGRFIDYFDSKAAYVGARLYGLDDRQASKVANEIKVVGEEKRRTLIDPAADAGGKILDYLLPISESSKKLTEKDLFSGNILKGEAPQLNPDSSLMQVTLKGYQTLGQMAPIILGGVLSGGMKVAAAIGFAQAADEGGSEESKRIRDMPAAAFREIPLYTQYRNDGLDHEQAKLAVSADAGRWASIVQGIIGSLDGLLFPGAGKIAKQILTKAFLKGGFGQAAQEPAESIGARVAASVAIGEKLDPNRIGAGTYDDSFLGFATGGPIKAGTTAGQNAQIAADERFDAGIKKGIADKMAATFGPRSKATAPAEEPKKASEKRTARAPVTDLPTDAVPVEILRGKPEQKPQEPQKATDQQAAERAQVGLGEAQRIQDRAVPEQGPTDSPSSYVVADPINGDGPETVRLIKHSSGAVAIIRQDGDLIDISNMIKAGFSPERAIAASIGEDVSGKNVQTVSPNLSAQQTTTSTADVATPAAPIIGSDAKNGFQHGPDGTRYRTGIVSATGGVMLDVRYRNGGAGSFYVGVDGNMVDADSVNLIGDGASKIWKPTNEAQSTKVQELLRERAQLGLTDPKRKTLLAAIREIVTNTQPNSAPILSANGQPFTTEKAALLSIKAKRLDATVVPVNGGFGIQPKASNATNVPAEPGVQPTGRSDSVAGDSATQEPPIQKGMTRLYHGSALHGRYDGKAWFSTDKNYAANYRGKDAELQYVDYPTDAVNKIVDPDGYGQTVEKGFGANVELDSSITGLRKPLYASGTPKTTSQETANIGDGGQRLSAGDNAGAVPAKPDAPASARSAGAVSAARPVEALTPAKPAKPKKPRKEPTLIAAIKAAGGLRSEFARDLTGETPRRANQMYPFAFRRDGVDLSTMVHNGLLDDFLPPHLRSEVFNAPDAPANPDEAIAYIEDAIRNGEAASMRSWDTQMALAQDAMTERQLESVADEISDEMSQAEIEHEIAVLAATNKELNEVANAEADQYAEQQIYDFGETAQAQSEDSSGDPGSRTGDAQDQGRASEVDRPSLELTGQTEGQIRGEEARRAKQQADQRARDNAPSPDDDFTLTGSDRAADVGAARGQNSLFEPQSEYGQRDLFADEVPDNQRANLVERVSSARSDGIDAKTAVNRAEQRTLPGRYATGVKLEPGAVRDSAVAAVRNLQDAALATSSLSSLVREHIDVVVTDRAGKILAVQRMFGGATSQASAYPQEIIKFVTAIKGSSAFYVAHNHPSDNYTLSDADRRLSNAIGGLAKGIAPEYRGIVSVTTRGYAGYSADGVDESGPFREAAKKHRIRYLEETVEKRGYLGPVINAPEIAKTVVPEIAQGQQGIVFLDAQYHPTGFFPVNFEDATKLLDGELARDIVAAAYRSRASAAMMATQDYVTGPYVSFATSARDGVRNVGALLARIEVRALDAINSRGDSRALVGDTLVGEILFQRARPTRAILSTAEDGTPQIDGDGVSLAFAQPTERLEFFPTDDAQKLYNFAIMGPGNKYLGYVEALFDNGRPTTLYDIQIEKQNRGTGAATAAVKALLDSAVDGKLDISNIVPSAQGFWERLGIGRQNLEDGATYGDTITRESFGASPAGKNAGTDSGGARIAESQDRRAITAKRNPALSTPPETTSLLRRLSVLESIRTCLG